MEVYIPSNVEELERRLGASWPNLQKARTNAYEMKSKLEGVLATMPPLPEEISLVVFGSLARKEFTDGSDVDWKLLVDGVADTQHLELALDFKQKLKDEDIKQPGQEGTFEGLAFSHDIIHKIGGGDDTNNNTTQRILLLLESESIGTAIVSERVIKGVLKRYIAEDHRTTMPKVPRFLLNDIVRYWRTMAVDFGYKRRQRQGKGTALRTIKLRMSRKLIFSSGLLACFACEIDKKLGSELSLIKDDNELSNQIINYLFNILRQPPLDILASIVLSHGNGLYSPAQKVFDSYDKFIGLINDHGNREHLEKLLPQEVNADGVYQEAKDLSYVFQNGLEDIFFSKNLFEQTKKYGVF